MTPKRIYWLVMIIVFAAMTGLQIYLFKKYLFADIWYTTALWRRALACLFLPIVLMVVYGFMTGWGKYEDQGGFDGSNRKNQG